jgi:hypothetical protein
MKNTKYLAVGALLILGTTGAVAQSLGDYARTVRKNKPEESPTVRHFDNDNLPTDQALSVVGPAPTDSTTAQGIKAPAAVADTKATPAAEAQKTPDEWKKKLDEQKAKVDSLSHELDLQQREYRLRAASYYGDAGARLRDAAQWEKDDVQYKSDVEGKQQAINDARQKLDDLQEEARKAGTVQKDQDKSQDQDKAKDGSNTDDKK